MSHAHPAVEESAQTLGTNDLIETQAEPVTEQPLLFGRYRTLRELGRGGMGVVVLAHDTVLDLQVALKLIPQMVVRDTEGIVDLKKEVLRGMELTHPGIVRVFSFEQDATTAAIVMEFVQGQSLAQLKTLRPSRCFDPEEILPWLEQLCSALDYAHTEARIAHRDLKPGNLMLTTTRRLKVADFGIAASLSDTLSRVSVRSETSGTPPYMSPQQAMGQRPTHLDDIYSLGATAYELLTGKPPFFRGNILAQVVHEEPASMSQRREEFGASGLDPIRPAWEKTIAACLAKSPEDRPQSGAAVLEMLKNPGRALVLKPNLALQPLQLGIVPQPEIAPVPTTPAVVAQTAEIVSWREEQEREPGEPSRAWQFLSSAFSAVYEIVAAIIRPIFKIALVLGALWGLLHVKGRWDALETSRKAEAAKLQARQAAAAQSDAPVRPQQQPLPPQPFQPMGPPPGAGPGNPPPFMPPPPPPPPGRR